LPLSECREIISSLSTFNTLNSASFSLFPVSYRKIIPGMAVAFANKYHKETIYMRLRGSVIRRTAVTFIASILLLSLGAAAQEMKSEISVQGTGLFTKDSDGNGIRNQATNTGGFLVGYRYNYNRWLGGEAAYGYARNTQLFSGFVSARVQSNVHQITGGGRGKAAGLLSSGAALRAWRRRRSGF
jgi:hypothetical protein